MYPNATIAAIFQICLSVTIAHLALENGHTQQPILKLTIPYYFSLIAFGRFYKSMLILNFDN